MATINIQDFAAALEANPRTVRKFLRSVTPVENQPGKGGRWQIEKKDLRSLKKKFETYIEEHTRPQAEVAKEVIEDNDDELAASLEEHDRMLDSDPEVNP